MGSWWSDVNEEQQSRKITLIGCKGSGKSYFIECFEHMNCDRKPTKWVYSYTLEYDDVKLNLFEIGAVSINNKHCLNKAGGDSDCIYFFLDATKSIDSLFDSKQLLLATLMKLSSRPPLCIILNVRSPEEPSFTFKDVERTFQFHLLAEKYSILLVKLTFKSHVPIRYMFDWTIYNSKGRGKGFDDWI